MNIRDKEWWDNRSESLKKQMRLNRLWFEKGLREISKSEPIRLPDVDFDIVPEDWSCEIGGDREPDGKVKEKKRKKDSLEG